MAQHSVNGEMSINRVQRLVDRLLERDQEGSLAVVLIELLRAVGAPEDLPRQYAFLQSALKRAVTFTDAFDEFVVRYLENPDQFEDKTEEDQTKDDPVH